VYLLPEMALPSWFPVDPHWVVPLLWIIFVISEITDLIDGKIARSRKEVSDFGKLFDPFADVLVRITYFLCFVVNGILSAPLFLIVLYREFGIQFLRNLMLKKGVTMGARKGGKLKAFAYMLAGALALLTTSMEWLGVDEALVSQVRCGARVIFLISVLISVVSFADYYIVYHKTARSKPDPKGGDGPAANL
jgi:CDP-diacylglycerol--glycerol-3-phosphate 3-phosphatidyltransferase